MGWAICPFQSLSSSRVIASHSAALSPEDHDSITGPNWPLLSRSVCWTAFNPLNVCVFLTFECCLVQSQMPYKILSAFQICGFCQPEFEWNQVCLTRAISQGTRLVSIKCIKTSFNSLLIESHINFSTALTRTDVRPVSPTWKNEGFVLLDLFGYWLREKLYRTWVLHPANDQHVHCCLYVWNKSL